MAQRQRHCPQCDVLAGTSLRIVPLIAPQGSAAAGKLHADLMRPAGFQLDLSQEAFFGEYPISRPVTVTGHVKNVADVLMLEGEAKSLLDYTCDRCMCRFSREKAVSLHFLLAETLEGEDDDIVLLDQGEVDVGELAYTAFILDMDTKHLCSEDCKGLCPGCGVNLNQAPCRCKKQADPRWAALEQLLNKN